MDRRRWSIPTQEQNVCDVEIEIVAFVDTKVSIHRRKQRQLGF